MCLKVYPYLLLFPTIVRCVDPSERVGLCKDIKFNLSPLYVNANEGVWFPQYRSKQPEMSSFEYSCHTIYETVYFSDKEATALESIAYFTRKREASTEPYITEYVNTGTRGNLTSLGNTADGDYQVFNYILNLTPEYRVRYLCTTFSLASPDVTTIYIETRQAFPPLSVIKEAAKDIRQYHFGVKLLKIRQRDCRRPLFSEGYKFNWKKSD